MEKFKYSPLKVLDKIILEQIEQFKESNLAQKLVEQYNIREDHQQKYINFALMIFTIILPLLVCLIFFFIANSASHELALKQEIIEKSSKIVAQKAQMQDYTSKVFGGDVSSGASFKSKISSLLNMKGVDTSKIQINDYDSIESGGIVNSQAKLKFTGFSDQNLFASVNALFIRENFKLKDIFIEKNPNTKLLDGEFTVLYYSKVGNP